MRDKEGRFDFKLVLLTAGACISFMVGAGTCTGQEIMQSFTSYGYWGIASCILSFVLSMWFGAVLIDTGRKIGAKSQRQVFEYFLGKKLAYVMDLFTVLMVFVILVVMLAGAGSSLTQYLGIPELPGRIIAVLLVLVSALLGLKKFFNILGSIGPLMILLGVIICVMSIIHGFDGFATAGEAVERLGVPHFNGVDHWWLAAIMTAAYTSFLAASFYTRLGSEIKTRKNAVWSGLIFGFLYMLFLSVVYFSMLVNIEKVYDLQVPTLGLAAELSPILSFIFALVIIMGIYSTAVPMCWTVADRVAGGNKKRYTIAVVAVCIIGFFGSLFPFGKIINVVYPYFGYVGLVFFAGMFIRYNILDKLAERKAKKAGLPPAAE